MNLRDQLKEILPEILPRNPNHAIKGTELIESVKNLLKQEYSDATLRYHFSIMSCDPSSPIAKVAQGQGYYLRTETIHAMNSAMNMISASPDAFTSQDSDVSIARANKFRAVVQRYFESINQTPFSFEESFSENAHFNRWRVPDLAVVRWKTATAEEDGLVLNRNEMDVYRRLSLPPIEICSAKLRLELRHHDIFEDLYQSIATSDWANGGQIMVAAPIEDPILLQQIREFSNKYGIGVTSFGLDSDIIDDLPEPAAIENLTAPEFDAIRSIFTIRTHTSAEIRPLFNWEHVSNAGEANEDFSRFDRWVSSCFLEERVISPREFLHKERTKIAAVA